MLTSNIDSIQVNVSSCENVLNFLTNLDIICNEIAQRIFNTLKKYSGNRIDNEVFIFDKIGDFLKDLAHYISYGVIYTYSKNKHACSFQLTKYLEMQEKAVPVGILHKVINNHNLEDIFKYPPNYKLCLRIGNMQVEVEEKFSRSML